MILVPAFVALVLLGLLPVGSYLVEHLAFFNRLPPPLAWLVLASACIGGGRALMGLAARRLKPSLHASEDDPIETGTLRGQGALLLLLVPTWIALGYAGLSLGLADPWRMGFCGLCLATMFKDAPLGSVRWLPKTRRPPDPRAPTAAGKSPSVRADADDGAPATDLREVAFQWTYAPDGREGTRDAEHHGVRLQLRRSRCESFRLLPHPEVTTQAGYGVLGSYVTQGITPEVLRVAQALSEIAAEKQWLYLDLVGFVVSFAREAIAHVSDLEAHGVEQRTAFPLETLASQRGDDEDHAILAASLLRAMDLEAVLFVLELSGGDVHVALGVPPLSEAPLGARAGLEFRGKHYYYIETTPGSSTRIGELPEEYAPRVVRIIPVPLTFA